jgi:electron transfer flavoprotein alpha subunit
MILVFAEHQNGKFKKATYEVVFYGKKLAEQQGTTCGALVLGEIDDAGQLGKYGADHVWHVSNADLNHLDSQQYVSAFKQVVAEKDVDTVIVPHSSAGKTLVGRLSVALDAGVVSAASALPETDSSFSVIRPVFAGKAFATYQINSPKKVISLTGNTIKPEVIGDSIEVENIKLDLPAARVIIKEVKRTEGIIPLPEAELVVSAGRGMKGPENWGIIEELAAALGATTACSRPVSDADWRPHHEHVGQTGIAIRPNLYVAIGISGAIQHLAGVNNSKVIVVVNKDPEAPFFKAADYGVVGDLFEVVPRIIESVKKLKAQ